MLAALYNYLFSQMGNTAAISASGASPQNFSQNLSVLQTSTASLQKNIGIFRSVSQTTTASMTEGRAFSRTFNLTSTTNLSVATEIARNDTFAVPQATTSSIAMQVKRNMTFLVSTSSDISLSRGIDFANFHIDPTWAVTSTSLSSLTKRITKPMSVSSSSSPSVSMTVQYKKNLSIGQVSSATLTHQSADHVSVGVASTSLPALTRAVTKNLAILVSGTPDLIRNIGLNKAISSSSVASVSLTKQTGQVRALPIVASSSTASLSMAIQHQLTFSVGTDSTTAVLQVAPHVRTINLAQAHTPTLELQVNRVAHAPIVTELPGAIHETDYSAQFPNSLTTGIANSLNKKLSDG
jgi:hypothetical protein